MATTLTIGGVAVAVPGAAILDKCVVYAKGGIPSLVFLVRGGALPTSDPYLGRAVSLSISGTVRFVGDVVSVHPAYDARYGWVRSYQCLGLRHRGDKCPHTDATSGIDSSAFNLPPEDRDYDATRAGRTVGQILTTVLTMAANAQALDGYGLGHYTGLPSSPVLPATTVADLAALDHIPPGSVSFGGEKLLGAVEALLSEGAPNHCLWIDPANGDLRFLDTRAFSPQALTMGTDPITPTPLSRDVEGCSQRVAVRGQPVAVMYLLKLSQGTVTENFAHDSLTTAAAKAAFKPSDYTATTNYQDSGNCTCPDTATVRLTTSAGSKTWTADQLDQTSTGVKATLNLYYTTGAGLTLCWTARVIANLATASGNTDCTVDATLPHTNFNRYTLTYMAGGQSIVYRQYQVADATIRAKVVAQSTYPQPAIVPGGAATMTSTPMAAVLWSDNNAAPYKMFPSYIANYDRATGNILLAGPTYAVAGKAPADVWFWLPVNTGVNQVASPADVAGVPQYAGTSHTVEGLTDTLTVTVPAWRDPAQASAIQKYADDLRDSVKDAVIEGTVVYHGLYTPALTMGTSLNISASGYAVPYGWDTAALPVVEYELEWGTGGAMNYTSRMRCSNRRAHYSAGAFMHPDRTGITWGPPEGHDALVLGGGPRYGGDAAEMATPTIGAGYGGGGDLGLPTMQDGANLDAASRGAGLDLPTMQDAAGLGITGRGNNFGSTGLDVSRSPTPGDEGD